MAISVSTGLFRRSAPRNDKLLIAFVLVKAYEKGEVKENRQGLKRAYELGPRLEYEKLLLFAIPTD